MGIENNHGDSGGFDKMLTRCAVNETCAIIFRDHYFFDQGRLSEKQDAPKSADRSAIFPVIIPLFPLRGKTPK